MQSELPTALNVSDTDYPLEYNERSLVLFTKKLLERDISTVSLYKSL